jgi:hypothetical protein
VVGYALITASALATSIGGAASAKVTHSLPLNVTPPTLHREVTARIKGAPVLAGFTSQGGPIVLALSRDAKTVRLAETALVMKCTSGNEFVYPDAAFGLAIRPNGRVHIAVTASFKDRAGDSIKLSHSLGATINRRRWTASGVWQVRMNVTRPTGQTDSCDSGAVSFHTQL